MSTPKTTRLPSLLSPSSTSAFSSSATAAAILSRKRFYEEQAKEKEEKEEKEDSDDDSDDEPDVDESPSKKVKQTLEEEEEEEKLDSDIIEAILNDEEKTMTNQEKIAYLEKYIAHLEKTDPESLELIRDEIDIAIFTMGPIKKEIEAEKLSGHYFERRFEEHFVETREVKRNSLSFLEEKAKHTATKIWEYLQAEGKECLFPNQDKLTWALLDEYKRDAKYVAFYPGIAGRVKEQEVYVKELQNNPQALISTLFAARKQLESLEKELKELEAFLNRERFPICK